MKYVKVLQDRGLAKEELSKALQEKIERVEKLVKNVYEFENQEDLTEDDEQMLTELREDISILDEELEKKVLKFNPEHQKKRLEYVAKAQNKANQFKNSTVKTEKLKVEPKQKIDELKETVKIKPEVEISHEIEEKPEPIVRAEAEKADDYQLQPVQPKRNSWSLIMMVVGGVLMGIGGYNFFKNK